MIRFPKEKIIENIQFIKHKFGPRKMPTDPRNVVIFSMFSEFGCEIVGVLYIVPYLMQTRYMGKYSIVVGWHGREYLYRHLVDEFWEIDEEHQWLREYAKAFHHESKNLKKVERKLREIGRVISSTEIGNVATIPKIDKCPSCQEQVVQSEVYQECTKCHTRYERIGLFNRVEEAKSEVRWLPPCSPKALNDVKKWLPTNPIGIIARNRITYGRNLPSVFYERLIYLIEDLGYNPVWIGEKVSTLPCPLARIPDYSRSPDAKDLELTLALVSQLRFTIQFWTASTRLSGLVGTPFILFESPDQLYGSGQEGFRLNLCTKGQKKIVVCQFSEKQSDLCKLAKKAITEMEESNFNDLIGLVEDENYVKYMCIMAKIGE